MTDRASIIEKAARAMCRASDVEDEWWGHWLVQAEAALDAIVPPGEAWIAPWSLSDEQADIALSVTASHLDIQGTQLTVNREKMKRRFERLRDRYLSDKGKG